VASRKLRITLTKSLIGLKPKQQASIRALGLRRIRQSVVHEDSATLRGMIAMAPHVLEVRDEA
jgi:large subunit ribosomal protein L30